MEGLNHTAVSCMHSRQCGIRKQTREVCEDHENRRSFPILDYLEKIQLDKSIKKFYEEVKCGDYLQLADTPMKFNWVWDIFKRAPSCGE